MITITGDLLRFAITSLFLLIGMYTLVIMYIIDRLAGSRMYRRKNDYVLHDLKKDLEKTHDECSESDFEEVEAGAEFENAEYASKFLYEYEARIANIREELENEKIEKAPPAPISDTEYVDGIPLVDIYDTQTSYDLDAGSEIISDVQEKLKYDKAYIQN